MMYSPSRGGCVWSHTSGAGGDLTLSGVSVLDCTVTGTNNNWGGAVATADGRTLTVLDSEVAFGTCLSTDGTCYGGGILGGYSTVVYIDGSFIHDNEAVDGGGVLTNGPTPILDTAILNNSATQDGCGFMEKRGVPGG